MALPVFTAGRRLRASELAALVDEVNAINADALEVVKSSDTTRISTATLAVDPHLSLNVLANSTYTFTAALYSNSGTTPDVQYAMAFPAGASVTWGGIRLVTGATVTGDADFGVYVAPSSAVSAITAGGTAADQLSLIEGTIVTAGTAGSLAVWWAQATTTASNTILRARSSLVARRVR